MVYNRTLAERCISVAFCPWPLLDVGIDFSFIPVSAADQMHAVIVCLRKSDARFSKCHMHCVCYLCDREMLCLHARCAMWLLISTVRIDMASVIPEVLLADSVIAWHETNFPF